jgi:hypothetical protein
VYPIFFLYVAHAEGVFTTLVPHIFPSSVPQVEACLADIYLSVFLDSRKSRFIFSPGNAVEGILCPFFLVNDVFFQLPIVNIILSAALAVIKEVPWGV